MGRDKDEDEGIPSETEDDKRQLETKAKEMRGEEDILKLFAGEKRDGSGDTKMLLCFAEQIC